MRVTLLNTMIPRTSISELTGTLTFIIANAYGDFIIVAELLGPFSLYTVDMRQKISHFSLLLNSVVFYDDMCQVLKWLQMTHDLVPRKTMRTLYFHSSFLTQYLPKIFRYPVFFYYLRDSTLLPHACQLLVRLTERSDVTPYRIGALYPTILQKSYLFHC